jgi:hypothetical protein
MKIKIGELRTMVRKVVKEAVAQGVFQKKAKKSYANMIDTVGTGGNKNTKPFLKKAKSSNLKSAPPGN